MGCENMKNKFIAMTVVIIAIFSLFLSGCVEDKSNAEQISVLVTIVPQIELVSNIGGDYVDVTVMVPAGQSPHSFEPTPDQMIKIAQASAYYTIGSGVEFEIAYMNTILEQNPDLMVYDCSREIDVISFDEHYGQKGYSTDEDLHHNHNGTDPHIWTSPVNFKKMAEVVYEGLSEIDPTHQDYYYENYQSYTSRLDLLDDNLSSMLQPYEGKSFMVYHPAWGYFGDAYNLEMIAIEEGGKQPGPAGIAAIIDQAKNQSINVIFISPQFDSSSAQTIADEIGGEVVFADSLTSDYIRTLQNLGMALVNGYS
jgi:zinc transport system substrate-binding protein